MRVAPPAFTRARARAGAPLLGLVALALTGCGGGGANDAFAPTCPKPSIPTDFNDLHRYRGAGRDITDSVLEGRIVGVRGGCTRGDGGANVTTVTVAMDLTRGPAATSRTAGVSYFVAVSKDDTVLNKQVYRLAPEFPSNTDRLSLLSDEIEVILPAEAAKTPAAYRISVGFQLTEIELADNRRRLNRR